MKVLVGEVSKIDSFRLLVEQKDQVVKPISARFDGTTVDRVCSLVSKRLARGAANRKKA